MTRIGLIGLGVMGRNLALNFADHGIQVIGLDTDEAARARFGNAVASAAALVNSLPVPRLIVLLVPAGEAVDGQLADLLPLLAQGDMVVDCGNSFWKDTERREAEAARHGITFVGMGLSGGEEGARHGPSLMAGGNFLASEPLRRVFAPVAAKVDGQPCFGHFGGGGAGHFVKMIHNGIEYADMQMIAEAVFLLRRSGMAPTAVADTLAAWNDGPLGSYLMEISAEILAATDAATGRPLLDVIVDSAGQKGTGHWAATAAMQLGIPAPTIAAAVDARCLSAQPRRDRRSLPAPVLDTQAVHDALLAGKICAYAQGFSVLDAAAREYGWSLDPARCATVWRGGCIIRARLLDDIRAAATPDLLTAFAPRLREAEPGLRRVVGTAVASALPVPALASALSYLDGMGTARLWADMIQAQRDRFGAHGFKRVDRDGVHHGPWADKA